MTARTNDVLNLMFSVALASVPWWWLWWLVWDGLVRRLFEVETVSIIEVVFLCESCNRTFGCGEVARTGNTPNVWVQDLACPGCGKRGLRTTPSAANEKKCANGRANRDRR